MRILITGAAGFVGSHLVDRLIAEGHEVIGIDNFITGRPINLQYFEGHKRFQLIKHDLIKPVDFNSPLDWVMHFASPASPPKYLQYPIETLRVNSEGTLNVLELALRTGAGFFLASTSEVYGDPELHPQGEDYWGRVNPVGPRSVYDEGKRYAEALTMAYHRVYGLDIRIVRIFNTYGPRMDPGDGRVVSNFITQALKEDPLTVYGDGSQTRSFQYIDDLIEGILRLMTVKYTGPVNLGNPEERTMLDLAEIVKNLTKTSSPIVFRPLPQDDPRQRKPDIQLAKSVLGWEPSVGMEQGLLRTITFFREVLC